LRKYIEAMGGKLNIVAELPGRPPVYISEFSQVPDNK
ncbi:MAG: transcriptional regulator, partial [Algicola sp.]|nr:transcriptional regulator [Algicola sp.]